MKNNNENIQDKEILIPDELNDFVYFVDGNIQGKQKIPKDLEKTFEEFVEKYNKFKNVK